MSVMSAIVLSRKPALGFLAIGLFWGGFAAAVPQIKAAIDATDAQFGSLLLCNAIGLVSAMLIAPRAGLVLGSRAMQVGMGVFACAMLFPGFATGHVTFALAMVLMGLASGLTDVLVNTQVSELESRTKRPLMNANHGVFSVGYMVAALAMGGLRQGGAAPWVWFVFVACVVAGLAAVMRIDSTEPEADTGGSFPFWPIALCGGIVLIAFMAEATVETWSALHIERTLHGSAAEGALGPAMLGFTMAIGRFSGQAVAERFSVTLVLLMGTALSAGGGLLAALASVPILAYVGFGIFGLGISVIGPLGLALVGQMVSPKDRSAAIAKASIIGFSGFFIAPALMGLVSETYGLRVAFLAVVGIILLLVPMAWAVRR